MGTTIRNEVVPSATASISKPNEARRNRSVDAAASGNCLCREHLRRLACANRAALSAARDGDRESRHRTNHGVSDPTGGPRLQPTRPAEGRSRHGLSVYG